MERNILGCREGARLIIGLRYVAGALPAPSFCALRGALRVAKAISQGLIFFGGFGRIRRRASRFARAKSELLVAIPWPGFDASARRRGDHGEHPHALAARGREGTARMKPSLTGLGVKAP